MNAERFVYSCLLTSTERALRARAGPATPGPRGAQRTFGARMLTGDEVMGGEEEEYVVAIARSIASYSITTSYARGRQTPVEHSCGRQARPRPSARPIVASRTRCHSPTARWGA